MREKNLVEKEPEEAFNSLKDNFFLILNCYSKKMSKLNVLIAGATGYIGIELVKILIKHKYVNIKYLCGNNSAGKKISFFDKSLIKQKLLSLIKNF